MALERDNVKDYVRNHPDLDDDEAEDVCSLIDLLSEEEWAQVGQLSLDLAPFYLFGLFWIGGYDERRIDAQN